MIVVLHKMIVVSLIARGIEEFRRMVDQHALILPCTHDGVTLIGHGFISMSCFWFYLHFYKP